MSIGATTELALIPEIGNPQELFIAHGLDPIIATIEAKAQEMVGESDISTERGRKMIASVARKVASSKAAIDEAGKNYKARLMEAVPAIDAERRRMREALESIAERVRAPLTEYEERDARRIEAHEAAIRAMGALLPGATAEDGELIPGYATATPLSELESRLAKLPEHYARNWEEFAAKAKKIHGNVEFFLKDRIAKTQAAEAERAELERLRAEEAERKQVEAARQQREREEQLQKEAAERARLDAEIKAAEEAERLRLMAEREKQELIERGRQLEHEQRLAKEKAAKREVELLLAASNAKAKAEADRAAAEQKAKADTEAAVTRERERVKKQQEVDAHDFMKRSKEKAHRDKIEGAAFDALMNELTELGETHDAGEGDRDTTDGDRAQLIVEAIADGRIPHVSINY